MASWSGSSVEFDPGFSGEGDVELLEMGDRAPKDSFSCSTTGLREMSSGSILISCDPKQRDRFKFCADSLSTSGVTGAGLSECISK